MIHRRIAQLAIVVCCLGCFNNAHAQLCERDYSDLPDSARVPDDDIEALVLAYATFGGNTVKNLSDLVERRLWLRALGEPVPRLATMQELREQKWPEPLEALRDRGTSRILAWQPVATWMKDEPPPPESEPADMVHELSGEAVNKAEDVLSVRLRLTNKGRVSIAAVDFNFYVEHPSSSPGVANGLGYAACPWRLFDPIPPGQSRDIICRWAGNRAELEEIKTVIEHPAVTKPFRSTLTDVSFHEAGHRIPYEFDNHFSKGSDPDIAHVAAARKEAACPQLKTAAVGHTLLRILLWIVLPGFLGVWLGRRHA
jgi:hypothetical protein